MESDEISKKIEEKKKKKKEAQERGDIYFPFSTEEREIKELMQNFRFAKAREWADWYELMIPKKEVLNMLDELREQNEKDKNILV